MSHKFNALSMIAEDRFEPCKVCGEPSSGWHCGAVTCEACKKFFLRSINGEDAKYKCIRNKDCVIVRTTRTQCQFCRFQKCKEVGMTINDNSNSPTVAEIFKGFPCYVCKSPSSGIHFGAITCEGCKGFFRRSVKERAPERYRCLENGNCEISASTRNMCRFCRFQKCISVGMSAKNSRIGRQSNLFKHNIIEWQSKGVRPNADYLVTQRKLKRVKNESVNGTNSMTEYEMINMNYQTANLNHANATQQIINVNQYTNQTYIINNINADGLKIGDPNFNNLNLNYNGYYGWNNGTNGYNQPNVLNGDIANNNLLYSQSLPQMTSLIEDSLNDSIKDLIKRVYKLYHHNLNPLLIINKNLSSKEYHSTSNLALTYNGYQTNAPFRYGTNGPTEDIFYKNLNDIMKYLDEYNGHFCRFLSDFKEFMNFNQMDREELIKCSIHSVIMLSLQRKCENYNYFNCDQAKFENYTKIFPIFYKTSQFMKTIHEKFEKFKLDDKEYALYTALLVISTSSKYLKDYHSITEKRDEIGTALRQYMFTRRNEEITCDEILLMLVYFRKINLVIQKGITQSFLKLSEIDQNSIRKTYSFFEKIYLPNNNELNLFKSNETNTHNPS
ncbi:unnamed protein product [Brachionus calyciflorus]|uniref:Nuclear receptor n=1 Tax=Brachionus calyciflorus TaxID=104777 RepID=A0A813R0W1_9BILA|nr:unnamed protein product [Brachionus calyciflorus]